MLAQRALPVCFSTRNKSHMSVRILLTRTADQFRRGAIRNRQEKCQSNANPNNATRMIGAQRIVLSLDAEDERDDRNDAADQSQETHQSVEYNMKDRFDVNNV